MGAGALVDLLQALAVHAEPPGPELDAVSAALELPCAPDPAGFCEVFLFQLYPYASVYLGAEGMLGGEARDRVAGFFRALGVQPPPEPDHLAVLLAAYAQLHERGAEVARAALLWEHLLPWLPPYLHAVAELRAEPYRSWALLLDRVLREEAGATTAPPQLALHLRAAPELPDPRQDSTRAFTDALLVPVRTGMIVTGRTLAELARDTGLGLRVAERRYALRNLLDQDPHATLAWLAGHARRWAGVTAGMTWTGEIAMFWQQSAEHTAALLESLAAETRVVSASYPG